MKKTLLKAHTDYRFFTRLRDLILYGCNTIPKSDHEIASVDANVYERVKTIRLTGTKIIHKKRS